MLVAAQLPAYLVHQAEEHLHDRFRASVNTMVGCEALSRRATFWINMLGVWLIDLVSLGLMVRLGAPWGLPAVYLTLVNAVVHILAAVRQRRSNPGLITAVVLFLPLRAAGLLTLARLPGVKPLAHVAACGFVVAVHAAIIGWVLYRSRVCLAGNAAVDG